MFNNIWLTSLALTFLTHLTQITEALECRDMTGRSHSPGAIYVPGPNPCNLCMCNETGAPKHCRIVLCNPPTNCKSFRVGPTCCEFICIDDTLLKSDTGFTDFESSGDLGLRLIASAVTAILSLSLLFFLIHRIHQRKVSRDNRHSGQPGHHLHHHHHHGNGQNSNGQNDDDRGIGYITPGGGIGYLPGSIGYIPNGGSGELEFRYGESSGHFGLWKPPGHYFPRGEAPPPYDEAVAAARAEAALAASNSTHSTVAAITTTSSTAIVSSLPIVSNPNFSSSTTMEQLVCHNSNQPLFTNSQIMANNQLIYSNSVTTPLLSSYHQTINDHGEAVTDEDQSLVGILHAHSIPSNVRKAGEVVNLVSNVNKSGVSTTYRIEISTSSNNRNDIIMNDITYSTLTSNSQPSIGASSTINDAVHQTQAQPLVPMRTTSRSLTSVPDSCQNAGVVDNCSNPGQTCHISKSQHSSPNSTGISLISPNMTSTNMNCTNLLRSYHNGNHMHHRTIPKNLTLSNFRNLDNARKLLNDMTLSRHDGNLAQKHLDRSETLKSLKKHSTLPNRRINSEHHAINVVQDIDIGTLKAQKNPSQTHQSKHFYPRTADEYQHHTTANSYNLRHDIEAIAMESGSLRHNPNWHLINNNSSSGHGKGSQSSSNCNQSSKSVKSTVHQPKTIHRSRSGSRHANVHISNANANILTTKQNHRNASGTGAVGSAVTNLKHTPDGNHSGRGGASNGVNTISMSTSDSLSCNNSTPCSNSSIADHHKSNTVSPGNNGRSRANSVILDLCHDLQNASKKSQNPHTDIIRPSTPRYSLLISQNTLPTSPLPPPTVFSNNDSTQDFKYFENALNTADDKKSTSSNYMCNKNYESSMTHTRETSDKNAPLPPDADSLDGSYQCLHSQNSFFDEDDYRSECENCKSANGSRYYLTEDYEHDQNASPNETMTLQRRPTEVIGEQSVLGQGSSYYLTSTTLPTNVTKKTTYRPSNGAREAWFSSMPESTSSDEDEI